MKKYILLGVFALLVVIMVILVVLLLRLKKRKSKIDIRHGDVQVGISGGANPITGVIEESSPGLINNDNRGTLIVNNMKAVSIRLEDIDNNIDYGYISLAKEVIVGSQYGDAKLKIRNDPTISKAHCMLYSYNMVAYVKDIGSCNGTFVNGKKICTDTIIRSNDVLILGNTHLRVEIN